jgi:hypothetical protein
MRQLSVIVPFSHVQARTFAAVGLLGVFHRRGAGAQAAAL